MNLGRILERPSYVRYGLLASFVLAVFSLGGCEGLHDSPSTMRMRAIERAIAEEYDPTKPKEVIPGVVFTLPNESGWRIRTREPREQWFRAIRVIGPGHTAAVHVSREYPQTADFPTPHDFLRNLGRSLRALVPGESQLLDFQAELAPSIAPYCVKYLKRTKSEVEGRAGELLYQLHGIGCRHPDDPTLFLNIGYSELLPFGRSAESDIAARAERFFQRVRLIDLNLRNYVKEVGFVGLRLAKQPGSVHADVVEVMPGFDALRQGVRVGDRIVEIDGVDVKNVELAQVISQLRGDAGTKVGIVVTRNELNQPLKLNLTRLPSRFEPQW